MTPLRMRFGPEDRERSIYQTISFEVPASAPAVAVDVAYDRRAAVVDLGLLDPDGFRGWSGSNKQRVTVAGGWATPGYCAGPLPAGEWQVLLGLHRVPAQGVEVAVEVTFARAPAPEPRPLPPLPERPRLRELPAAPGRRWLAGDLHAHTIHSDGILSVPELACLARSRGLDYLAITDHNTISHHAELPEVSAYSGVLLVPGVELTTDRGHANCLGASSWIDFRRDADDWLADGEACGGLLSINHPVGGDMSWRQPMTGRPPLVEVWHSSWDRRGGETLAWWEAWGGGLPIGGSDFHAFGRDGLPGAPTTWLEVEGGDALGALRAGRIAISAAPDAPVVVRDGDEVLVVDGDGATLHASGEAPRRVVGDRFRVAAGEGPYRLVDDAGLALALTP